MIDLLDWIILHPIASCIISLFLICICNTIFENFHIVNITNNYYDKENKEINED